MQGHAAPGLESGQAMTGGRGCRPDGARRQNRVRSRAVRAPARWRDECLAPCSRSFLRGFAVLLWAVLLAVSARAVLAAPATAFADAAARVLSVTPGVRYDLNGTHESLAVKMDVPVRAVVESDATGKAQLIFPDDSTLSIAPDTRIALAEYVDVEREENIVLDLVSGTARVITGESNRKNPQAFTVNTPQASIGIRGTLVTIQASGDVTRVYLSETSGLGVSVRNLHTGQVIELRKPGTIINVGADFMEERKASKEEAASYSAALRGKSRAAIQAATAQAEMRRAAAASITPEGSLPPAGLADPVQVAALATDDRLTQARLVADATPVPSTPAAPDAPVVPAAPVVPETPAAPEIPDPVPPLPPLDPELPPVISDFSQIASASFEAPLTWVYHQGDISTTISEWSGGMYGTNPITIIFDSSASSKDSVFTFNGNMTGWFTFNYYTYEGAFDQDAFNTFVWQGGGRDFATYSLAFTLNKDGSFSANATDAKGALEFTGKLDSDQAGKIVSWDQHWTDSDHNNEKCSVTITTPVNLVRK